MEKCSHKKELQSLISTWISRYMYCGYNQSAQFAEVSS